MHGAYTNGSSEMHNDPNLHHQYSGNWQTNLPHQVENFGAASRAESSLHRYPASYAQPSQMHMMMAAAHLHNQAQFTQPVQPPMEWDRSNNSASSVNGAHHSYLHAGYNVAAQPSQNSLPSSWGARGMMFAAPGLIYPQPWMYMPTGSPQQHNFATTSFGSAPSASYLSSHQQSGAHGYRKRRSPQAIPTLHKIDDDYCVEEDDAAHQLSEDEPTQLPFDMEM